MRELVFCLEVIIFRITFFWLLERRIVLEPTASSEPGGIVLFSFQSIVR